MTEPDLAAPERVGIVLVHGIGEQRRFEHLEGQVRGLIESLKARPGARVHVEILGGPGAAYFAEQATWHGGPEGVVRITVREPGRRETHLHLHEVWWADVNESYTLTKQLRFWLWGLAVWNYPGSRDTDLASAGSVKYPVAMRQGRLPAYLDVRLRLFGVAMVFLLGSLTIGLATVLAKRLLNLDPPDIIRTFVNYLSAVKLYSQRHRGTGWRGTGGDFLDALDDPPRVSIRRRMARVLAEVALQRYDRWYVLGHSQGSVVAFNGLMETAWAWPGYLDEELWQQLVTAGMAGPMPAGWAFAPQDPAKRTMPPRPPWVDSDIAYRPALFAGFRGLLTYGSPIGKFGAIWPARVPLNREPAFDAQAVWLNVFDPIDPVSGPLKDFAATRHADLPERARLPLTSIGYAASGVLLLGHIGYLRRHRPADSLADGAAEWLLTGSADRLRAGRGPRFFAMDSGRDRRRRIAAHVWWIAAFAVVTALAALGARWLLGAETIRETLGSLPILAAAIVFGAALLTLLAGLASRWSPQFRQDARADEPA
jgi:hypothetical protein